MIAMVSTKYDDIFDVFAKRYLETMTAHLLVFDDGLNQRKYPFEYIDAPQPFAYVKNMNSGIIAAGSNDIIIFNDDVYIHTVGMDIELEKALHSQANIGIVAPMSTNVMNVRQHPENKTDESFVITNNAIPFVCVAISRQAINKVGLLDRNYAKGVIGYEDEDYCLTLSKAGYKLGIAQNCFIEHGGEHFNYTISNTRQRAGNVDSSINRQYFLSKWAK